MMSIDQDRTAFLSRSLFQLAVQRSELLHEMVTVQRMKRELALSQRAPPRGSFILQYDAAFDENTLQADGLTADRASENGLFKSRSRCLLSRNG